MHYTRVYYWVSSWWANRIGLASLNETVSDIDVLINSVANAGENWELDSHS